MGLMTTVLDTAFLADVVSTVTAISWDWNNDLVMFGENFIDKIRPVFSIMTVIESENELVELGWIPCHLQLHKSAIDHSLS